MNYQKDLLLEKQSLRKIEVSSWWHDFYLNLSQKYNPKLICMFEKANKESKLWIIRFYKFLEKAELEAANIIGDMINDWVFCINDNKNICINWFEVNKQSFHNSLDKSDYKNNLSKINNLLSCLNGYCNLWLPKSLFIEHADDWVLKIDALCSVYTSYFSWWIDLLCLLSELWMSWDYQIYQNISKDWKLNKVFLSFYPWYYGFSRFVE